MKCRPAGGSCRLSNNAAGVALLDEFPKIGACCISNNAPCDSSTMNSQLIERHLDVDTMPAAIPMRWADPHAQVRRIPAPCYPSFCRAAQRDI